MAMFTAFFDASGNALRQPYVAVAGYIANYGQWETLDGLWKETHWEFEVELPFHMSEFVAANCQPLYAAQKNARADYIEIAKDSARAEQFLFRLSRVQAITMNCAVACFIDMNVYNGVSTLLELREVVPPWVLGAQMCLERVRQWEQYFNVKTPVECIFESGDFEQGRLSDLMREEGKDPPIYKSKRDFCGLQAADHYVWEQYYALTHYRREDFAVREGFRFLLNAVPARHTHATQEFLIGLCERKGIDPRTGVKK